MIQCGSCEQVSDHPTKDLKCPNCHSGNWVYGFIDEPDNAINALNEVMKTFGATANVRMLSMDGLKRVYEALDTALEVGRKMHREFEMPREQALQCTMASLAIELEKQGLIKDEFFLKPDTN